MLSQSGSFCDLRYYILDTCNNKWVKACVYKNQYNNSGSKLNLASTNLSKQVSQGVSIQ